MVVTRGRPRPPWVPAAVARSCVERSACAARSPSGEVAGGDDPRGPPSGALSTARAARLGRDVGGLQGPRHLAAARGGGEGPPPAPLPAARGPGASGPRGPRGGT